MWIRDNAQLAVEYEVAVIMGERLLQLGLRATMTGAWVEQVSVEPEFKAQGVVGLKWGLCRIQTNNACQQQMQLA